MKGYMTVEASLVLPMIFGMFVFVISMLFYSYDRCLLEQETAAVTICSEYTGRELKEKSQFLAQEIREWYLEKYVWMDVAVRQLLVKEHSVYVEATGDFRGPYFGEVSTERKAETLSPTFWLRQKVKMETQLQK